MIRKVPKTRIFGELGEFLKKNCALLRKNARINGPIFTYFTIKIKDKCSYFYHLEKIYDFDKCLEMQSI